MPMGEVPSVARRRGSLNRDGGLNNEAGVLGGTFARLAGVSDVCPAFNFGDLFA